MSKRGRFAVSAIRIWNPSEQAARFGLDEGYSNFTHLANMNPSAPAEHKSDDRFFEEAHAAMLRASREVVAENKRLGLPLVVEVSKRKRPARKRFVKRAVDLNF